MKFYSMQDVCELFGVSRTTIGRWEEANGFPRRVRLGIVSDNPAARPNCRIGFPTIEVDSWAQKRMDDRRPSEGVKPLPDEED
jgi:predicted DNA-binding transcriptional regulator AlpA